MSSLNLIYLALILFWIRAIFRFKKLQSKGSWIEGDVNFEGSIESAKAAVTEILVHSFSGSSDRNSLEISELQAGVLQIRGPLSGKVYFESRSESHTEIQYSLRAKYASETVAKVLLVLAPVLLTTIFIGLHVFGRNESFFWFQMTQGIHVVWPIYFCIYLSQMRARTIRIHLETI